MNALSMAAQLTGAPVRPPVAGRKVLLADVVPKKQPKVKKKQNKAAVEAAKEQAQAWVDLPCGPTMNPVKDVLVVLMAYIGELEGDQ